MINCVWAMLCRHCIVNEETDNISLIEVVEEVVAPPRPNSDEITFVFFEFSLVIYWKKEELADQDNQYKFRLRLLSPSQEVLFEGERNLDFNERLKILSTVKFIGLPVPESGLYEFQIQLPNDDNTDWRNVYSVTLAVNYELVEGFSENESEVEGF